MYATMNRLSFGEHRGGMFVAVEGVGDDGQRIERSWHLLAEGEAGPLIPSMAAEAIVRRCLADKMPQPGARAAATDLELADYEALFERRRIRHRALADRGGIGACAALSAHAGGGVGVGCRSPCRTCTR